MKKQIEKKKTFFYEVFLKLVAHGKEIGRTCVQLEASSAFMAAVKADKAMEGRYGKNVISRTMRVSQITEDEFLYCMAA